MADINYTFDDSLFEEAIRNEVQEGNASDDNNKVDNDDSDNKDQSIFNYDLDKAIQQELGQENTDIDTNKEDNEVEEHIRETTKKAEDSRVDISKSSEENSSEENDTADDSVDPYRLALEVIREEQLLDIPEDFDGDLDADTIDQLKERTYYMRDRQILESRRQAFADDPEKLKLFDYFFFAEADADIPKFNEINESIKNWSSFDISKEENQKHIITEYFKDTLNPNSPGYSTILSTIEPKVQEILDNYEGEEQAKKAKEYFLEKENQRLKEEEQRILDIKKARENEEVELHNQRIAWNKDFQASVQNKDWRPAKKQQVLAEQYSEVLMGDEYVPVWYAKEQIIKSNPELYVTYLDWLSNNFDLESGKFKDDNSGSSNTKKETTRRILELINKKKGVSKSHQTTIREPQDEEDEIINPLDNI